MPERGAAVLVGDGVAVRGTARQDMGHLLLRGGVIGCHCEGVAPASRAGWRLTEAISLFSEISTCASCSSTRGRLLRRAERGAN